MLHIVQITYNKPFEGVVAKPGAITLFFGAVSVAIGLALWLEYSNNNGWNLPLEHFSTTCSHLGPI
jgi:hypothetical protein